MLTPTPRPSSRRQWWIPVATVMIILVSTPKPVISQPEINILNNGCNQYNATNLSNFFSNLNGTFSDLRSQLSSGNTHFATAQQARSSDPVYGMAQCRNYLSTADCLACFDAGVTQLRKCSVAMANGAIVIYDGCFVRYDNNRFYDQATLPGNMRICGNRTISQATTYYAVQGLIRDLIVATPRINGYFAASSRAVNGGDLSVYAVAQCAETVSRTGCEDCLRVAHSNIQSCPPESDGRAIDVGCFLRYSNTSFFPANQTTNITPFLGRASTRSNLGMRLAVGFSISGGAVTMVILMTIFYCRRRRFMAKKNKRMDDKNVEEFISNHGSLAPKRFSYTDIKKMTNSFADKLGEGGYGSVFKGKLIDGRLVAVKVLTDTDSNGDDFINEVASISRTSHINIVTLLGFCLERNKRALVYEFMPNKSLENFIHKSESSSSLDLATLYKIAVGTARGLEYLHRGCNTRIVHFDIKPENILLDEEFCPKISDFGLAKLCQRKKSIISMMGPRGTPGYIAPEVFSRSFGEVSHKSDVYSYGMMVINMVGAGQNNEVGSGLDSAKSEMYFPNFIYKRLERGEDLSGLPGLTSEEGEETVKKMVLVSLWCIQTNPLDRPSMSNVVEMLEGNIESIQVPPKPILFDSCSALSSSYELESMESKGNGFKL